MRIRCIAFALLAAVLSQTVLAQAKDWPSYNRTLQSDRYATVSDIDPKNVVHLKVICSFDTGEQMSFQSGLLEVDGELYATTEHDTIALDPNTCKQHWRSHEDFPSGELKVSRGAAWLDHRIFRGTSDGKVIGYDGRTGKRLWTTAIADASKGESVPAAPIAWNGLVFIGTAGGDNKGVKGRMYALDEKDGHIVWEFYLVPRGTDAARGPAPAAPAEQSASWKNAKDVPITGGGTWTSFSLEPRSGLLYVPAGNAAPDFMAQVRPGDDLYTGSIVVLEAKSGTYQRHFQLIKHDFHDWDVSSAPVLFQNRTGKHLLAEAPKDGNLYVIDIASGKTLYRKPVTTIANVEAPLTPKGTRFCPGSQGGAEWNGAAFDASDNLILTGEVHWCTTVKLSPEDSLRASPAGQPWTGAAKPLPFGVQDDPKKWAGFVTASDADTGMRKWQFRAPFPVMSGMTPTSGRVLFFGDMGGTLYALDAASGQRVWSLDLGGAIGGGVITYDTGMGQKIAVAAGMVSPIWPTPKVNGKVVVLGL
jgi:alcohol dehydrogenase (cytochrome c)